MLQREAEEHLDVVHDEVGFQAMGPHSHSVGVASFLQLVTALLECFPEQDSVVRLQ